MSASTRRTFLTTTAAVAAGAFTSPLMAIEPFQRSGPARMKLSLAGYSMRRYFQADPQKEGALDMMGFVDWAATLDVDGVEPTSYYFPEDVTEEYLARLKRRCHVNGLDVSSGAIRNNFTLEPGDKLDHWFEHVQQWAKYYAALGAPVIRVFAGRPKDGVSVDQAVERAIQNLDRASDAAGQHGVMLALENHDFLRDVDRMMDIVKGVKSPWFGVNFDSGNLVSDDPYRDLKRLAPYAINAQIKTQVEVNGKDQPADLDRVIGILRDAGYRGYAVLEYEAKEDPYKAVPRYLDKLRKLIES